MTLETLSENRSFGGTQGVYRHRSEATGTDMTFAVYLPPDADGGPVNLSSLQADGTVAEDGADDQQEAAPAKKAAKRATKTAAADAPTGAGAPAKQAAVKKAPAKKAAAKKDAEPTEAADEK